MSDLEHKINNLQLEIAALRETIENISYVVKNLVRDKYQHEPGMRFGLMEYLKTIEPKK